MASKSIWQTGNRILRIQQFRTDELSVKLEIYSLIFGQYFD